MSDIIPADFDINKPADGFTYGSTKTYVHSVGLSCCFRQWRAESHCRFMHGYAIKVHLEFSSKELDHRHWAVDFGSLKSFKGWLEDTFDHKTLVATDDPELETFRFLQSQGLVQLREVPACGCEAMARMIWEYADQWRQDNGYHHVVLEKVVVSEHEGNSASYGRCPHTASAATGLRVAQDLDVPSLSEQQLATIRGLIDKSINQRETSRLRTGI